MKEKLFLTLKTAVEAIEGLKCGGAMALRIGEDLRVAGQTPIIRWKSESVLCLDDNVKILQGAGHAKQDRDLRKSEQVTW